MYELDSNGDHMVDFPEFLTKFLTATDEKELLSVFSQLAIREGEDEAGGREGAGGEGNEGEGGGGGGGGDRMLTPAAVERSFQVGVGCVTMATGRGRGGRQGAWVLAGLAEGAVLRDRAG